MTIKDKFLTRSDVYNLPCIVISNNPVKMYNVKNVLYLISSDTNIEIYSKEYKSSCIQTDIDGNDSFMIIFAGD